MPYFDTQYTLYVALPVLALTLLVQLFLKATYAKYSRVGTQRGLTGAETARRILDQGGVHGVTVEMVEGFLSDHYDPRHRVVRLSPNNYNGQSIAAIGVAAHEAGHALQHAQAYAPLKLRNMAVPAASIGSSMGYVVLVMGWVMQSFGFAVFGLGLLLLVLIFELINLPVEFDASRRALQILPQSGILTVEETRGARKVLAAAALTYVAAMIATLWTILFWAMRLGLLGSRRHDEN